MRKFFYLAAIVAVAATACNKAENQEVKGIAQKGEECAMTFKIRGANSTKATEAGIISENKANTVDIFVFYNGGQYDGQIDAYGRFSGDGLLSKTVRATTGARHIYAVVNSQFNEATLSAIATLTQFNALVATLASQKTAGSPDVLDNFTMIGHTDQTLVAGDNAVGINVDRIAARVRVKKITRNMDSPALQAKTFVVTDMYISNAVTKDEYDLGYTPVAVDFDNQYGVIPVSETHALWLHRGSLAQTIVDEHTTPSSSWVNGNTANYMYTFPNTFAEGEVGEEVDGTPDSNEDGTPDDFAPQCSKLVVKATLGGDVVYYVIPLPALRANYTYDIEELVITRRGSQDPNQKTQVANVNYTITVNPWTIVPIETENGGTPGDSGSKYII